MNDRFKKSLEVAMLIEDNSVRSNALFSIAHQLARVEEDYDGALEIIFSAPDQTNLSNQLSKIADVCSRRGLIRKAVEILFRADDLVERFFELSDIAFVMKDDEMKKKYNAMMIDYLSSLVGKVRNTDIFDRCIEVVANDSLQLGEFDRVFKLADFFCSTSKKEYLFQNIVFKYCKAKEFDKAMEITSWITDSKIRGICYDDIAVEMVFQFVPEQLPEDKEPEKLDFGSFDELTAEKSPLSGTS